MSYEIFFRQVVSPDSKVIVDHQSLVEASPRKKKISPKNDVLFHSVDRDILLIYNSQTSSMRFFDLYNVKMLEEVAVSSTDNKSKPDMQLMGCSTVFIPNAMRIVLFGGYKIASRETTNDMFEFDINSKTWTKIETYSPPSPRYHHSANLLNDSMIIFGGCDTNGVFLNDLHVLDIKTQQWSLINCLGEKPPMRQGHCGIVNTKQKKFYLFGGTQESELMNDFWEFNFETKSWTQYNKPKTLTTAYPTERMQCSGTYLQEYDILVVCFGWDGNSVFNDMFLFDCAKNIWHKIALTEDVMPPRYLGALTLNQSFSDMTPSHSVQRLIVGGGRSGKYATPNNFDIHEITILNYVEKFSGILNSCAPLEYIPKRIYKVKNVPQIVGEELFFILGNEEAEFFVFKCLVPLQDFEDMDGITTTASSEALEIVAKYIHGVPFDPELTPSASLEILQLAKELRLEILEHLIFERFANEIITVENVLDLMKEAERKEIDSLKQKCVEFISDNVNKFIDSEDFINGLEKEQIAEIFKTYLQRSKKLISNPRVHQSNAVKEMLYGAVTCLKKRMVELRKRCRNGPGDFTVITEDGVTFHLHKLILTKGGKLIINWEYASEYISFITSDVLDMILDYLYCVDSQQPSLTFNVKAEENISTIEKLFHIYNLSKIFNIQENAQDQFLHRVLLAIEKRVVNEASAKYVLEYFSNEPSLSIPIRLKMRCEIFTERNSSVEKTSV